MLYVDQGVLEFFRHVEPCLVGLEACGNSHYWANAISEFGYTVRLMPPGYVKADANGTRLMQRMQKRSGGHNAA